MSDYVLSFLITFIIIAVLFMWVPLLNSFVLLAAAFSSGGFLKGTCQNNDSGALFGIKRSIAFR